ncbi:MAG: hypothetical protein BM555_05190 [Crocinitomix sp. MedPE-SWsnd]|nr:MAG: hypothetical protein BM555_05190 [Crocinitomix sp. MedPE-SWsnd]
MPKVVIEITEDHIITKDDIQGVVKHSKGKFPAYVKVGDIVQYAEHGFHDVVDSEGNFIYR